MFMVNLKSEMSNNDNTNKQTLSLDVPTVPWNSPHILSMLQCLSFYQLVGVLFTSEIFGQWCSYMIDEIVSHVAPVRSFVDWTITRQK